MRTSTYRGWWGESDDTTLQIQDSNLEVQHAALVHGVIHWLIKHGRVISIVVLLRTWLWEQVGITRCLVWLVTTLTNRSRSLLCIYRLNWAMRTPWGRWDGWDDTALQTQDSKFDPWPSEPENGRSRPQRSHSQYEWAGKNILFYWNLDAYSSSFIYFHYCFIQCHRPYTHVGHWEIFVPRFHFDYFFQPFYQYGRLKKTKIIKYLSSLEICHFCWVLLRSKLIRKKCPHYVPRGLEFQVKKNLWLISFYNYIFRIHASLSLTLICGEIQMFWYFGLK